MFCYIFYDFIKAGGIIEHGGARAVIAVSLGLFAYRGVLVSYFIDFLAFGAFGISLLALNFIIIGGILAFGNRLLRRWQILETERFAASLMSGRKRRLKAWLDKISAAGAGGVIDLFNSEVKHFEEDFNQLGRFADLEQMHNLAVAGDANGLLNKINEVKSKL
jgi:Zn-dependent protease with chaperone function